MATPKDSSFLVVAIDFGTTYSGYAFSFKSEFNRDLGKISCNQWVAGSNQLISLKTPTVLLLKWNNELRDFTAEGFGYEAEDKYTRLIEEDKHEDYFLVERFKMDLYKQTAATGLSRSLKIKLSRNRGISTMQVFSLCIGYLKTHFLSAMEMRAAKVNMADIKWVLTVPAIWTDGAKQFMRESAVMAGIDNDNLAIALEPEAASLYCLHLPALDSESTDETEQRFPAGTKYMVVDCGGGTVDICVHEIVGDRSIVEKHVASGGNWGGTMVDENFLQIWIDIVGGTVFKKFKKLHREDLSELYREFEYKKRSLKSDQQALTMRIPLSLVNLSQDMKGIDFKTAISRSKYAERITSRGDKFKIDIGIIRSCFTDPVEKTVEHVKLVLEDKACEGVDTIVLVGGFAESCFLQEAVKANFSTMKIVIPEEPSLAVLKGAVLFGHVPLMIKSRYAKYTYGMRITDVHELILPAIGRRRYPFHATETLTFLDHDMFDIHVKKGESLRVGQPQKSKKYFPLLPKQRTILIDVFSSTDVAPKSVTDDSCSNIGSVEVDIPVTSQGLDRPICVTMTFGGTEIEVRAEEERTKRVTEARLNLLE